MKLVDIIFCNIENEPLPIGDYDLYSILLEEVPLIGDTLTLSDFQNISEDEEMEKLAIFFKKVFPEQEGDIYIFEIIKREFIREGVKCHYHLRAKHIPFSPFGFVRVK